NLKLPRQLKEFGKSRGRTVHDPGCVKTLRGIIAPGILGSTVMRRAKKSKNLSSARHYDQIRFRFHTWGNSGLVEPHSGSGNQLMRRARPYCGENPEPGKDVTESLTPRPEFRERPRPRADSCQTPQPGCRNT